jgi:hypothetical protein
MVAIINTDNLISLEVVTTKGKGRQSYLKLNSTKRLLKKDEDVIDVADKPTEWLNDQLQKRKELLEFLSRGKGKNSDSRESLKIKKEIKQIEEKLRSMQY